MFIQCVFRSVLIGSVWLITNLASLHSGFGAPANVVTWHNDISRSGVNAGETVLTPVNVNSTDFGKLFQIELDGQVFAQPLYLSGIEITGKGLHNVLFI